MIKGRENCNIFIDNEKFIEPNLFYLIIEVILLENEAILDKVNLNVLIENENIDVICLA